MADCVLYKCSCGMKKPIHGLYFCRHCEKLRCGNCVSSEVDTCYCPNCLENMPSAEARLKKNRCANCFDCPSCGHTLSTRASSIQIPNPEDNTKTIPKKVYYLFCGFCRWTSRDIGLADQSIASGGWPELENPHGKTINSLLDYYRTMAQREKAEDRKILPKRRGFNQYSDKYGLTAVVARKKAGLPPLESLTLKDDSGKPVEFIAAVATRDADPLHESYYTQPLNLESVCTLSQRYAQPEFQPIKVLSIYPQHKHLAVKQSRRCKVCEHNVSKPEFNPVSVKFKIILAAMYHVPGVKVQVLPRQEDEKDMKIILIISNQTQRVCHVKLSPLDDDVPDVLVTSQIELPAGEISIQARDDTAELYDLADGQPAAEFDPKIVAFQTANKCGVFATVIPGKGQTEIVAAFKLQWDYVNTIAQTGADPKVPPQIIWLETKVYITLDQMNTK